MRAQLLALAMLLPACGQTGGTDDMQAAPDMAQPPDLVMLPDLTAPFPGFSPSPPQVVSFAGPVLKAPKVVGVFFSNDDPAMVTSVVDFESKVGKTNYWKAILTEYGVGAATATAPVMLAETATGTIDDSAIQTWLGGKLNGDDPAFPVNDANTVYAIHYPAGVTITLPNGGGAPAQSCQSFGGYHGDFRLDATHASAKVSYAVIPRCSGFGFGMNDLDTLTGTESHELAEAASDPYPNAAPAFAQVDDDHIYWETSLGGGEIGDLCAQDPAAFVTFPELPYVVQRSWSNLAIIDGHDPCVPALDGEVNFNAAPEMADTVTFRGIVPVTGVLIPQGQSKTIPVDLFSDGPIAAPWTVQAFDTSALFGGTPVLDFAFDKTTGLNGDKLMLTITVSGTVKSTHNFLLVSSIGKTQHFWFGVVGVM